MKHIVIQEETNNRQEMADLLREIAEKIEAGLTSGYYPTWNLNGEDEPEEWEQEEIKEYTPPPPDNFPPMPENYTDEQLREAATHVMKEHDSKIKAMKFVKEVTGWGLYDAKRFCDTL